MEHGRLAVLVWLTEERAPTPRCQLEQILCGIGRADVAKDVAEVALRQEVGAPHAATPPLGAP